MSVAAGSAKPSKAKSTPLAATMRGSKVLMGRDKTEDDRYVTQALSDCFRRYHAARDIIDTDSEAES